MTAPYPTAPDSTAPIPTSRQRMSTARAMAARDLHAALLEAHRRGDAATLSRLYTDAADGAASEEEAGFFLTHAFVMALDAGRPEAKTLRARLVRMGRDTP